MNKKFVPWIVSGALVVVLAGGGAWYYKAKQANAATPKYILGQVRSGNVEKTVNATGTVQVPTQYNLAFGSSGKVTEIDVKAGDQVKAGQVLAKIDQAQAEQQVSQAQTSLTQAELKLSQLQAPPSQVSVIQAENGVTKAKNEVASAQSTLQILQSYKNPTTLQAAIAKMQASSDQGPNSQLTTLQGYNNSETLIAAIAAATNSLNNAQNDLKLANAQLAQVNAGPNSVDLQMAQSQVAQAKSNLSAAQDAVNNTVITAPVAGTIMTINGQIGESPSSGGQSSGSGQSNSGSSNSAFITLMGVSDSMQVAVPVDEADIGSVQVGQPVNVTFDAYPNKTFKGSVTQVNPTGDTQSGVTTFGVTVSIPNTDSQSVVKPGMSANVFIVVAQKQNVLVVPSVAIHESGSQETVTLAPTGGSSSQQVVTVKIGVDDGTNAEVLQGLQDGQQVIVGVRQNVTASQGSGTSIMGGASRGIGGFGGGMGGFGGATRSGGSSRSGGGSRGGATGN